MVGAYHGLIDGGVLALEGLTEHHVGHGRLLGQDRQQGLHLVAVLEAQRDAALVLVRKDTDLDEPIYDLLGAYVLHQGLLRSLKDNRVDL